MRRNANGARNTYLLKRSKTRCCTDESGTTRTEKKNRKV